jgi:hypothetical protein
MLSYLLARRMKQMKISSGYFRNMKEGKMVIKYGSCTACTYFDCARRRERKYSFASEIYWSFSFLRYALQDSLDEKKIHKILNSAKKDFAGWWRIREERKNVKTILNFHRAANYKQRMQWLCDVAKIYCSHFFLLRIERLTSFLLELWFKIFFQELEAEIIKLSVCR